MTTNLAIDVAARLPIINPIAVAHVEAGLGAVPPDRMLDEPRKRLRKTRIELPGIDPVCHGIYNVGAGEQHVDHVGSRSRYVLIKLVDIVGDDV
jgi:hypothetical protein